MDATLTGLLDELARFGQDNDARETERPRRMLNITPDTGRLLWILIQATGATRILEVGTSNAFSTIWLADAARGTGGRVTTLELNPDKVAMARPNLARAGLGDLVEIIEGPAGDTLRDLSAIAGAMVRALEAIYHTRPEYPQRPEGASPRPPVQLVAKP